MCVVFIMWYAFTASVHTHIDYFTLNSSYNDKKLIIDSSRYPPD